MTENTRKENNTTWGSSREQGGGTVGMRNTFNSKQFRSDQIVLAKSKGVWYQKNIYEVLNRKGVNSKRLWCKIESKTLDDNNMYFLFSGMEFISYIFGHRHKGRNLMNNNNFHSKSIFLHFTDLLPNLKILLIVRDPIGECQKTISSM